MLEVDRSETFTLQAHNGICIDCCWHPTLPLLATIGADGGLVVYDLSLPNAYAQHVNLFGTPIIQTTPHQQSTQPTNQRSEKANKNIQSQQNAQQQNASTLQNENDVLLNNILLSQQHNTISPYQPRHRVVPTLQQQSASLLGTSNQLNTTDKQLTFLQQHKNTTFPLLQSTSSLLTAEQQQQLEINNINEYDPSNTNNNNNNNDEESNDLQDHSTTTSRRSALASTAKKQRTANSTPQQSISPQQVLELNQQWVDTQLKLLQTLSPKVRKNSSLVKLTWGPLPSSYTQISPNLNNLPFPELTFNTVHPTAFSNQHLLATASLSGAVSVFHVSPNQLYNSLQNVQLLWSVPNAHKAPVSVLKFNRATSTDDLRLLSAAVDGTLAVWNGWGPKHPQQVEQSTKMGEDAMVSLTDPKMQITDSKSNASKKQNDEQNKSSNSINTPTDPSTSITASTLPQHCLLWSGPSRTQITTPSPIVEATKALNQDNPLFSTPLLHNTPDSSLFKTIIDADWRDNRVFAVAGVDLIKADQHAQDPSTHTETQLSTPNIINSIYLFDTSLLAPTPVMRIIRAHLGEINCLKWCPNGIFLVSAGEDCQIRNWRPILPHYQHFQTLSYIASFERGMPTLSLTDPNTSLPAQAANSPHVLDDLFYPTSLPVNIFPHMHQRHLLWTWASHERPVTTLQFNNVPPRIYERSVLIPELSLSYATPNSTTAPTTSTGPIATLDQNLDLAQEKDLAYLTSDISSDFFPQQLIQFHQLNTNEAGNTGGKKDSGKHAAAIAAHAAVSANQLAHQSSQNSAGQARSPLEMNYPYFYRFPQDQAQTPLLLATGSLDCTVRLWDVKQGVCKAVYAQQKDPITNVKFAYLHPTSGTTHPLLYSSKAVVDHDGQLKDGSNPFHPSHVIVHANTRVNIYSSSEALLVRTLKTPMPAINIDINGESIAVACADGNAVLFDLE